MQIPPPPNSSQSTLGSSTTGGATGDESFSTLCSDLEYLDSIVSREMQEQSSKQPSATGVITDANFFIIIDEFFNGIKVSHNVWVQFFMPFHCDMIHYVANMCSLNC